MDEIKTFRALERAARSRPSGIGSVRDAVWRAVDLAERSLPRPDPARSYRYINVLSARVSSLAAAVLLGCAVTGWILVDDYMKGGAMLSSYYNMFDSMYALAWRVF